MILLIFGWVLGLFCIGAGIYMLTQHIGHRLGIQIHRCDECATTHHILYTITTQSGVFRSLCTRCVGRIPKFTKPTRPPCSRCANVATHHSRDFDLVWCEICAGPNDIPLERWEEWLTAPSYLKSHNAFRLLSDKEIQARNEAKAKQMLAEQYG